MAKSLVVVESPAKAKTINKYLGKDYKVIASMGHVRDLPKSKLGVDVEEGFEPSYEVIASRKKVLKELKDAAKGASEIYVATDPDREGEAIGWHLAEELGAGNKKKIRRLMFNEITKKGVLAAMEHPTTINKQMVDAQQARRVLDRLVGYKISPLLWDKVRRGLSAGRVQSVALKLVVDREREIERFVAEEYWNITARLAGPVPPEFDAKLLKRGGSNIKVTSQADGPLATPYGEIEVRRLTTVLKSRREPVTYWLTVGDQVIRSKLDKRLAEIRLAFTGQIPDGLLFRVSSIDEDPARAFAMQQRFAADLMSAVSANERRKLSGLATPGSAS